VAIAIGVLGKPNRPSYPIPRDVNPNVSFDVTSKKIENKDVLVVGGGDSASEYVQYLWKKNKSVTFSYRREEIIRMNDINKKTLLDLADKGHCQMALGTDIEKLEAAEGNKVKVFFKGGEEELFDHIVYALGGSTPKNFLEAIGIEMKKEGPEVNDFFESKKKEGIFLLGDLSAGNGGGSINLAFNNSHKAMEEICHMYLDCKK
jgi:thioredoxin reductase (NADPH)